MLQLHATTPFETQGLQKARSAFTRAMEVLPTVTRTVEHVTVGMHSGVLGRVLTHRCGVSIIKYYLLIKSNIRQINVIYNYTTI